MDENIAEGIIVEKKSRIKYLVRLHSKEEVEVRLALNYVAHGMELFEGAKVFVMRTPENFIKGYILTSTDFKLNGWLGWTEEHEPRPPTGTIVV